MKKILLIILTFFIGITLAMAETKINYDWGINFSYNNTNAIIIDVKVHNDYYESIIFYYNPTNYNREMRYYVSTKDGNVKKDILFEKNYYNYNHIEIFNEHIIGYYQEYDESNNLTSYFDIYDKDLKLLNTVEGETSLTNASKNLISETDKYIAWGLVIFDKKTNNLADTEKMLEEFEYADELTKAIESNDEKNIIKYITMFYETYFNGSYVPALMSIMTNQELLEKYEYSGIDDAVFDANHLAIYYYDETSESAKIDILNNEGKIVLNGFSVPHRDYKIILREESFYVIALSVNKELLEEGDNRGIVGNLKLTRYDYNGNRLDERNLNNVNSEYYFNSEYNVYDIARTIQHIGTTNDGFYITTRLSLPEGTNPTLGENETIVGSYDTIQKFYITNEIKTKTDGNGIIEVFESSRPGEAVTFIVTPKEGYELKELRVTDSSGNVIIYTDYKFTMPNKDVKIEATFNKVKPNPDTLDNRIALACIVLVIGIGSIVYNKKKKIWLE